LQRGCADSFLREAVECFETETIPGFMGQAKDTQNKDGGLKLMLEDTAGMGSVPSGKTRKSCRDPPRNKRTEFAQ